MSTGTSIKGLDSLVAKIEALGGNIDVAMERALIRPAKKVERDAKLLCTVDMGDLRNRIRAYIEREENKVAAIVGVNLEYAVYVEFGTGPTGEASKPLAAVELGVQYKQNKWRVNIPDVGVRYIAGQVAQPFLYPAYKQNEPSIASDITNVLNEEIRKLIR